MGQCLRRQRHHRVDGLARIFASVRERHGLERNGHRYTRVVPADEQGDPSGSACAEVASADQAQRDTAA